MFGFAVGSLVDTVDSRMQRSFQTGWVRGPICFLVAGTMVVAGTRAVQPQKLQDSRALTEVVPSVSPVEALAMLVQIVRQLESYVRMKDLASIHNEDVLLATALNGLLESVDIVAPEKLEGFRRDLTSFSQRVSALHIAADLNQQTNSESELGKVGEAFETVKSHFSEPVLAAAQKSAGTFTCPMHRDVVGLETDSCPKCGMMLDQVVRIFPVTSGLSLLSRESLRASVRATEPLTVGKPATLHLVLQKANGSPVLPSDLIETHTKRIHLLIIDGSLTDYHHEHPEPTRTPGEYVFSFTPKKPGSYRVWADLRAQPLGLQEYAVTDIPGGRDGEPLTDQPISVKTNVNGRDYELLLPDTPIKVGRPASARLRITSPGGDGFTELEPVMGSFAHIVGFSEDYKTVLHMHPKGPPVLDPVARGGPELEFQIYALRPGLVRLFAQVQIAGQQEFAPFVIRVVP